VVRFWRVAGYVFITQSMAVQAWIYFRLNATVTGALSDVSLLLSTLALAAVAMTAGYGIVECRQAVAPQGRPLWQRADRLAWAAGVLILAGTRLGLEFWDNRNSTGLGAQISYLRFLVALITIAATLFILISPRHAAGQALHGGMPAGAGGSLAPGLTTAQALQAAGGLPGPLRTLGKYELRGTLGRGAIGTVYDGWDPLIARRVAIKVIRLPSFDEPDASPMLERFRREVQAAGRLSHPNIVAVFDYGETDDLAYIVMEFVDGPTLKSWLEGHTQPPLADTLRIMADLLAGLHYSHQNGVVHRDIKPANIMIASNGQAKIADFGIARVEESSMTQTGMMLGTPAYMAPEQFAGTTVDARSDVYSAGVLLHEMLTGERLFAGSTTAVMHQVLNAAPPPPSQRASVGTAALDAVVARAIAKRPEQRYPTAAAFAAALQAAARESDATLIGMGSGERSRGSS
jgi:tRNA A-37 threonylcarbamoyl transferase component Bud32